MLELEKMDLATDLYNSNDESSWSHIESSKTPE